jgi:hypothetical protein
LIFDHISNDLKVEKLAIKGDQDFYWDVPTGELYAVKKAQPQLDVGRLSDDWDFLKAILNDGRVSLMLIHVAPLLRYIGQEIGQ